MQPHLKNINDEDITEYLNEVKKVMDLIADLFDDNEVQDSVGVGACLGVLKACAAHEPVMAHLTQWLQERLTMETVN